MFSCPLIYFFIRVTIIIKMEVTDVFGKKPESGWWYNEKLENAFSIEYKDTLGTSNPGFHKHTQYELLLCLSDGMFLKVDKHEYEIEKNTLLIFNSMDLHYFGTREPEAENKRYVLYFNPAFVEFLSFKRVNLLDCFLFRPFPDCWILELTPEQSAELRIQMDKVLSLQEKTEEECYGKLLYLQLFLAEILLNVNGLYRNRHNINNGTSTKSNNRVYDIISFIHSNYEDELTLDLLSQKFFINKFSLCELFRDVVGTTPNQYIINCRISKAKELLVKGHSVEDACAKSGFNNLSHFSRTFKSKVGLSPKQYQKSVGKT